MAKTVYSDNTYPLMKASVKTQGLLHQNTVLNKPQNKKLNLKVKPRIKQFSALRKIREIIISVLCTRQLGERLKRTHV